MTSGIVLTGGASLLRGVVELAEDVFNLPARIGVPQEVGTLSDRIRNPRYATVIGLLHAAKKRAQQNGISAGKPNRRTSNAIAEKPTLNKSEKRPAPSPQRDDDEPDDLLLPEPTPRKPGWISRAIDWMKNNL